MRPGARGRHGAIARRLRAVRACYGLPSGEYATRAGVRFKSYSQWESGDFRISVDGALKLRARYGITLDYIYTGCLAGMPRDLALRLEEGAEPGAG